MPVVLAPRYWGAHLLALVLLAAAVGLGLWQYGAWQAHRDAKASDLSHAAPLPLAEVMGPDDPFPGERLGQPVSVRGSWVPEGTVYVAGRVQDGEDGYWVVTPLAVQDAGGSALAIVRGWVADVADAPAPPHGSAEQDVLLQAPEGTGEVDEDPTDDVLPQLRMGDLVQHVDQDLYGAYGIAEEAGPGLRAAEPEAMPEVGALTGIRNLLYAIEWWFFGLFAAFIWWRWVTETTAAARAVEHDVEPAPGNP